MHIATINLNSKWSLYWFNTFLQIHLEKTIERWWDALLEGEPKIELGKIDCSRNLDELGNAEQMKVQELMWNHQQKLLNRPTSEKLVRCTAFYLFCLLYKFFKHL